MEKYIITSDEVMSLVKYLGKRPYEEVAIGIQMLSALPKLEEKSDELDN